MQHGNSYYIKSKFKVRPAKQLVRLTHEFTSSGPRRRAETLDVSPRDIGLWTTGTAVGDSQVLPLSEASEHRLPLYHRPPPARTPSPQEMSQYREGILKKIEGMVIQVDFTGEGSLKRDSAEMLQSEYNRPIVQHFTRSSIQLYQSLLASLEIYLGQHGKLPPLLTYLVKYRSV